jgi:hypothetical protein
VSAVSLRLVSRRNCLLCDEMHEALRAFGRAVPLPPVELIDVDSDPQLQSRYGLQVPVLLLGEELVCRFHFDGEALRRRLALR